MRTKLLVVFAALRVLPWFAPSSAAELVEKNWVVDGVTRQALLHVPSGPSKAPAAVMFHFHGHGGTMRHAARSFHGETVWPEAIVVYMQGLNTPGRLSDPEGKKPGWQHASGDMGDRDLAFFDAVLVSLKGDHSIDDKRIYASGHSNGGAFTYLLWAVRGDRFAAVAPSAAAAARLLQQLRPKPVLHLAGENDAMVKFVWQQNTINVLRRLNQCGEGTPWTVDKLGTIYESEIGCPVVTWIHPGGHSYVPDAPSLIVKFFKGHVKP